MKPVTSKEMQQIDKLAQEKFGIPSLTLMENAGIASLSFALDLLTKEKHTGKSIAIFCGKGNNGGDGLVIARKLLEKKIQVHTYLLCKVDDLKKDPAINFEKFLKTPGATFSENSTITPPINTCSLIIDAIFGTGFKGKPNEPIASVINLINDSKVPVLAIDVPSGLDATTGQANGACIKAKHTITFGLPKTGFYKNAGPKHTGKIIIKNIGFPVTLLQN